MQTGETTIRTRRSQVRRLTLGAGPKLLGRPWAPQRGGFTLTEIMIAMGVLAVGMGMVAGALHAGIQVHIRTIDDIMRQLIGDNSLAMVQARVRHSTTNGITDTYKLLTSGSTAGCYFGPQDMKYPQAITTPPTPYGAVVFMKLRKTDANSFNDYDVLIVPYTIIADTTGSPGTVNSPLPLTNYTVSADGLSVTGAGVAANLLQGTVVIDNRNGSISTVKSVSGTTATMTAKLQAGAGTNVTLTTLTVSNSGTGGRLECSKPVQTKTALSPDPSYIPGK